MATKPLDFKPEDVAGHHWVEVELSLSTPQEQMLQMQLAQAFRAPGADGKPQMSRLDIAANILKDPHPEETIRRADLEWLETNDEEVKGVRLAALRYLWKKDNAATVKDAERELNPDPDKEFEKLKAGLTPERLEQLIEAKARALMVQMQGGPPPEQQMAMAQEAQAAQQRQALIPPTALPYQENGPSPEVAPTQMSMTQAPQPMEATPEMVAMQMRRGRPQP